MNSIFYFWEIQMKFQLKALAVALALVAAVPAQAATTTAASGNSSLVLSVYDRVANISALFDLGKSYSDFNVAGTSFANSGVTNPGTSFSWNLTTGDYATAWTQYLGTATLANSVFAVSAADNTGSGAGGRGFIGTFKSAASGIVTQQVSLMGGNLDTYVGANGVGSAVLFENHSIVADGSSVANAGQPYAPNYFGADKNFNVGPITAGAVGSDLGVFQYTSAATSFAPAVLTLFGNDAKFNLASNGSLVYSTTVAAVPEADTWAMMLVGLGFMGFVARRKQA